MIIIRLKNQDILIKNKEYLDFFVNLILFNNFSMFLYYYKEKFSERKLIINIILEQKKEGIIIKGKRYQKKKKMSIKIIITLLIIAVLLICVIKNTSYKENKKMTTVEYITNLEEKTEEITNEVIPVEDVQIKELIQNLQTEKDLRKDNFAFFYYNLDSNKYYFYNENTYFTAASTIKMPIAMLYYDKIKNGEISLDDTITYTSNCYEAGAGTTAYTYSVGSRVPISFLLEQSIVNSDNTAINILINNLGYKNCKIQISKYASIELPEEFLNSNITCAKYAYDVVNYLYDNMENYTELLEYLKKSSNMEYLKKYITDYDVAHKYGSYNGYVHDYGIVFGENTYLIGIFTKNISNADELIAQMSLEILKQTCSVN